MAAPTKKDPAPPLLHPAPLAVIAMFRRVDPGLKVVRYDDGKGVKWEHPRLAR